MCAYNSEFEDWGIKADFSLKKDWRGTTLEHGAGVFHFENVQLTSKWWQVPRGLLTVRGRSKFLLNITVELRPISRVVGGPSFTGHR